LLYRKEAARRGRKRRKDHTENCTKLEGVRRKELIGRGKESIARERERR